MKFARNVLAAGLVLQASCALGQAGADWSRVRALTSGTPVHVSSLDHRPLLCEMVLADETQLTCLERRSLFFVPLSRRMVISRDRIKEVRLTNRGLSTLAGAAIGVAVGVGVGFAVDNRATQAEDPGLPQVVFGLVGALVGAPIGHGTDFVHGSVVYRAP